MRETQTECQNKRVTFGERALFGILFDGGLGLKKKKTWLHIGIDSIDWLKVIVGMRMSCVYYGFVCCVQCSLIWAPHNWRTKSKRNQNKIELESMHQIDFQFIQLFELPAVLFTNKRNYVWLAIQALVCTHLPVIIATKCGARGAISYYMQTMCLNNGRRWYYGEWVKSIADRK